MSPYDKSASRKTIDIIICSKYILPSECLKLLLESKSEIRIRNVATTTCSLIQKVSQNKTDVVLFYLMEDESENIEVLPELFELSPSTKVLVLSNPTSELDQTKILKLGVTGIVSTHQKVEVLIRAIRQVSEGDVWFSQKLIAQLLGNGSKPGSVNKCYRSGMPKHQDLTEREFEVVESIALGFNNKQISKKLFISEATVRHHLSSIYSKLYIEDRLNLVIYAFQNQIVHRSTD